VWAVESKGTHAHVVYDTNSPPRAGREREMSILNLLYVWRNNFKLQINSYHLYLKLVSPGLI
jgi:hypothetical protein